jgi:hypothetical protein
MPQGHRWIFRYLLPPLLYMGLIFGLSSIEYWDTVPRGLLAKDKSIHSIEYAVLGLLWCRLLLTTRLRPFVALTIAGLLGTIYGLTDEIHQYYVPGRYCDRWDALADAAGAFLGSTLNWWWSGWE